MRSGFGPRYVTGGRCTTSLPTLERLRQVASRTSTPPAPLDIRIVEEVVHGEDIRRALGPATDLDLSIGQGPEISGPALALLPGVTADASYSTSSSARDWRYWPRRSAISGARKSPRGEPGAFS
jgi:hypothetical protein